MQEVCLAEVFSEAGIEAECLSPLIARGPGPGPDTEHECMGAGVVQTPKKHRKGHQNRFLVTLFGGGVPEHARGPSRPPKSMFQGHRTSFLGSHFGGRGGTKRQHGPPEASQDRLLGVLLHRQEFGNLLHRILSGCGVILSGANVEQTIVFIVYNTHCAFVQKPMILVGLGVTLGLSLGGFGGAFGLLGAIWGRLGRFWATFWHSCFQVRFPEPFFS